MTTICKCFNNIECKGKTVHCDHTDQLHQILHNDGDQEQMWRDEVKNHHHSDCNPKKVMMRHMNQIMTKFTPAEPDSDSHTPEFDIIVIGAIAAVQHGDATTHTASNEEIQLCIQTLGSDSTTPEEQALGQFAQQKLKSLSNWNAFEKGEHKQLNQSHKQGVFVNPFDPATLDPDAIVLSPTWQCVIKCNGTRQSSFSAMEERELPQSSMQLHPLSHRVWKCPPRGHFLCCVLQKDTKFMVLTFRMPAHMPRHEE